MICNGVFVKQNEILNQSTCLTLITSTKKYANDYHKSRIGKIFNTKNEKKAIIRFPKLVTTEFDFSNFHEYFTTCGWYCHLIPMALVPLWLYYFA